MESDKELSWTYLDTRGSDKFKDLLFDHVYENRRWKPEKDGESVLITRDDLDDFDHFDLVMSLIKQCKEPRFPLPSRTGQDMPYDKPDRLPPGLNRGNPPRETREYCDAIDLLINSSNREGGYRYNGRWGQYTGGFTPPNYVYNDVLENLMDWISNHIKEVEIKMPKTTLSAPSKKKKWEGPATRYSGEYADELKAAFCYGLGVDPAAVKEDFLELFSIVADKPLFGGIANRPIADQYAGGSFKHTAPKGETFEGMLYDHFEPETSNKLREANVLPRGYKHTQNRYLRQKMHSALAFGNYKRLLTPDDVYKIGYMLRREQLIDERALPLGEMPVPPARLYNQLDPSEYIRNKQQVAPDAPEAPEPAADAPAIVRDIRGVSIRMEPAQPEHERVAQFGIPYNITLTKDGEDTTFSIDLPPSFSPEALLDSAAQRLARLKADAVGIYSAQQAMRDAVRQRMQG